MPDEAIYYVDYIYQGDNFNPSDLLTIADMEDLWGQNISEPLLCIEHLNITPDMITIYQKTGNTLKIILSNGVSLLKFKATDEECFTLQNFNGCYEINLVGRANKNTWMDNITAQIFID